GAKPSGHSRDGSTGDWGRQGLPPTWPRPSTTVSLRTTARCPSCGNVDRRRYVKPSPSKTMYGPSTGRYVNERLGRGLEIAHSLASPDSVLIHPYPQRRVRARVDAAAAQGHVSTLCSDTGVGLFTQCPF